MELTLFLQTIQSQPEAITFEDTILVIENYYRYMPVAFSNGNQHNKKGENEGSCKIFAFGLLHSLTTEQTLHCFGQHYQAVLHDPNGDSHQNIRQFMQSGWDGITFEADPLTEK